MPPRDSPRPVDLQRTGGLSLGGIAQVTSDATVFSLELLDCVKRVCQAGDCRAQSPTGNQQQREAGTVLFIVDANGALFVESHGASFSSLLTKYARRGGQGRHRGTCL